MTKRRKDIKHVWNAVKRSILVEQQTTCIGYDQSSSFDASYCMRSRYQSIFCLFVSNKFFEIATAIRSVGGAFSKILLRTYIRGKVIIKKIGMRSALPWLLKYWPCVSYFLVLTSGSKKRESIYSETTFTSGHLERKDVKIVVIWQCFIKESEEWMCKAYTSHGTIRRRRKKPEKAR